MVDTVHWAWLQPATFPGFSTANPDNLGPGLNGTAVSTGTYLEYGLRDLDGDGIVFDMDNDDGSTTAPGEGLVYGGVVYKPQELAVYDNSTIVVNGVTYTVPLVVVLSETGNWGVRILDGHFPPGAYPADITSATLGTFNGVEYSGANVSSVDDMLCFAPDVPIRTPQGWRPAGMLRPGDLVQTDRGAKPLVWTARMPAVEPPVEIPQCAFGAKVPVHLSRCHAVKLTAPEAELLFGSTQVLAPAGALLGWRGVHLAAQPPPAYVHLMCEDHEILHLPGLRCESFRAGPMALRALPPALLTSLRAALKGPLPRARLPILKAHEARLLLTVMEGRNPASKRIQRA